MFKLFLFFIVGQQKNHPKAPINREKKYHHKSNRTKKESLRAKRSQSSQSQLNQSQLSDEENENESLAAGLHSLSIQVSKRNLLGIKFAYGLLSHLSPMLNSSLI